MNFKVFILIGLLLFLYLASFIRSNLENELGDQYKVLEFNYTLPEEVVKLTAFGYDTAIGDLYWLLSLQNMDIENQRVRKFSYLYHLLNNASSLIPKYHPIYIGGGGFLSVIFWDYHGAEKLFHKGLKIYPQSVNLHTFLAMLYMTDLQDFEKSAYHMNEASKLKGAPPWYKNLAARLYVEAQRPDVALQMLTALYRVERNKLTKKELAKKIKLILIDKEIVFLKGLIEEYKTKYGKIKHLNQLVKRGLLKAVPSDPFGGKYYISDEGEIKTTSTAERYRPYLPKRYKKNGSD